MFFSVIIPAYNSEDTIARCLQSVKMQVFCDFEVIIIDDGSQDKTGKICKGFGIEDSRFLYYYKENGGVSSARNLGILMAQGKYLTFLDSDDVYKDNYLLSFFEVIKDYPNREHYWCGYQYISKTGLEEGSKVFPGSSERVFLSDRSAILNWQEKELAAQLWNKVFVRDIVVKHRILMPPDLSLGEDYIFNLRYLDCCSNAEIVMLNEANYGYCGFQEGSLNKKYRQDLLAIYERLLGTLEMYLLRWGVLYNDEQNVKYSNIVFYMYDIVLRNTFHENNKDSVYRKIKYNNQILKSKRFRNAIKSCNVNVNRVYMKLYRFGHYGLLLFADRLIKIKEYVKRCFVCGKGS